MLKVALSKSHQFLVFSEKTYNSVGIENGSKLGFLELSAGTNGPSALEFAETHLSAFEFGEETAQAGIYQMVNNS